MTQSHVHIHMIQVYKDMQWGCALNFFMLSIPTLSPHFFILLSLHFYSHYAIITPAYAAEACPHLYTALDKESLT